MAGVAVHMMAVQDQLMAEMNQIQVQTLICSGTDDKLTAVSGNRALLLSFLVKSSSSSGQTVTSVFIMTDHLFLRLRIRPQSNSEQQTETLSGCLPCST